MGIKHLVISGGGPSGLYAYGAAKVLAKDAFWDINEIKTIYGTSIGAFIGVILSLKYDWSIIDDYLIKRPWEKLINISPENIFSVWESKGLIGFEFMTESLKPLLEAKELKLDITLKELYEYTNIEMHMFAVDLNALPLQATDISYKTFPDLQLVKALTMTAAIPFIFKPVIIDDKCFVDGGLILNFPLDVCLRDTECEREEVLAFKNLKILNETNKLSIVTEDTSLGGFWYYMTKVLVNQVNGKIHQPVVPNTVNCIIDDVCGYSDWAKILETKECREKCIKNGETSAYIFKNYKVLH